MKMLNEHAKKICLTPELSGVGGMVSFQRKLIIGMRARGIETSFDLSDDECDSILVIGGTRHLAALRKANQRGARIVQRLDGINWVHRQSSTGPRHWLRAEYGNRLLATIRKGIAGHIVYQSEFVRKWWQTKYSDPQISNNVIHNGVDLAHFNHAGKGQPSQGRLRLLLVEGSLMGGYEFGLDTAVHLAERIALDQNQEVELVVAGLVSTEQKEMWSQKSAVKIEWKGLVSQDDLPALYRSAHLLYSADLNAACPNAVIEAMACGLPVVAFDTGALAELLNNDAGILSDYGADPWKLETPDIPGLAHAAMEVLDNQDRFRAGARARAEEAFGLDQMVAAYLDVLRPQNG
jgi:glycosyltransferase involved in cell wall biosynthesis